MRRRDRIETSWPVSIFSIRGGPFKVFFPVISFFSTFSLVKKQLIQYTGLNIHVFHTYVKVKKVVEQFVRIHMKFFSFFSNLRDFLFSFEKTIKSGNLDMFSQKNYALHSRSFWIIDRRFANTMQIFFDKRGSQKLEKNLKKLFICNRKNLQINFS